MIATFLVCLGVFAAEDGKAAPPPLTADQLTQVRTLVAETQAEHAVARQALADAQADLARCYSQYELDEKEVSRLQTVVLQQQQRLLDSHHRLQKELRKIVGAQRFQILSRRIENVLKNPSPTKSSTSDSPK